MVTEHTRKVAWSVLKWLKQVQSSELKDDEEIGVAIDCISNSFNIRLEREESVKNYEAGIQLSGLVMQELARKSRLEDSLKDVTQDEKFKDFVNILKAKGYFQDAAEGSVRYLEKLERAKEKYSLRNAPFDGMTPDQLKNKGNQCVMAHNFIDAIQYYSRAVELEPTNAILFANRAAAYTHVKDFAKAIEDSRRAVALDPSYSKAHSRLGTALFYTGQLKPAIESYERALEIDPENPCKDDLKIAKEKFKESDPDSIFANATLNTVAAELCQRSEFNSIVQQFASEMANNKLDFDAVLRQIHAGSGADPSAFHTPIGDIAKSDLEAIQKLPEYTSNAKLHAFLQEARTEGVSALLKYSHDSELMNAIASLSLKLLPRKQPGQGSLDKH